MYEGPRRCAVAVFGIGLWLAAVAESAQLPVTEGLELRFDATVFSGRRPGMAVTEWRDTSGHQRHATSGSGGALYGEFSTPSGLYAVSFHDSCEEAMTFCYNPNNRDITVVAVSRSRMKATEWPYYFHGFLGWSEVAGETPLALGGFNTTQTVVALSGFGEEGFAYSIVATHPPETGFTVNSVRLNSTAGVFDAFRDQQKIGELTGMHLTVQGADTCGQIGGLGLCKGIAWAGDVAEILVYSRALTDAERQAVEDYLRDKWLVAFKAYDPNPANGAVNVLLSLPTWSPGHTAWMHEVYIGTTPDLGPRNLLYRSTTWPPTRYREPNWKPLTTYYWRVDEVEADLQIHTGELWTFVTAPSTAHEPNPPDGARFVDASTTPTWQPGLRAASHDVYFGLDKQAVLNGTGGTFRGRQDATTFDAGLLAGEKTYYWRVDEIMPGGQVHAGEVWSFQTLGAGGGIKAEYFNNMSRYGDPVVTRVDRSVDFRWNGGSPDPSVEGDYFSVRWTGDLAPTFSDTYTLTVRTNGYVRLWVDGRQLIDRRFLTPVAVDDKAAIAMTAGRTYPIQMDYEVGQGEDVIQLFWQSPAMARQIIPPGPLQPPLRAREPFPAHGRIETQHDLTLRWTPGWKAAQHDVYFGRDFTAVANATPASDNVYMGRLPAHLTEVRRSSLQWGPSYYWRIDEVNEAEAGSPWKGNVWKFTTADFLPIDDFESYRDEDGSRIYETWVDGWINGTGSTVGYVIAGSQSVRVHRGAGAMPFDYNNTEPPYYSETERTWSEPQDWTVHDADRLGLWFAGAPISFLQTPEGRVVLSGSGGEMECTYDPYRFVYKRLTGDGQIVARVEGLSNGRDWARAGVLIADTPDTGSQYAILAVTAEYGLLFGYCPYDSFAGMRFLQSHVFAPSWLKLVREGDDLSAQYSSDGFAWHDVTDSSGLPVTVRLDLPEEICIGLCVSSHKADVITTAEFTGIAFTGEVSPSWELPWTDADQPGNSQAPLYVALEDAEGHMGLAIHPSPGAVNFRDWTQWSIPLSSFAQAGVDLTSIRHMVLGVGDRTNPKPDGSGMIYIDDIRVISGP